jgi:prepilin-type N-terminal cleavage/methylation domain-containing protein
MAREDKMGRRGFTLVELLVVIAVIAILAAMILPVMLQTQEAAKMRTCASDMRQLGCAISQYMEDNSGFGLPPSPPDYENAWILCVIPLRKYVAQEPLPIRSGLPEDVPNRIWVCSGDVNRGYKEEDRPYWYNFGSSYMYPGPTAYQTGTEKMQKSTQWAPLYARKPYTWRTPKRDILLADYWVDFHSGERVPHGYLDVKPADWVSPNEIKSINVIFLDMHSKPVTVTQRTALIDNVTNYDNPDKPAH